MNTNNEQSAHMGASFEEKLQRFFTPSLRKLLAIQLQPSSSFASLAAYLKKYPLLSGKLLHLINAPDYGFRQPFTDLQRAATAVGTGNMRKITLALALRQALDESCKREDASLHADWRIVLWGAVCAEAIAMHLCPHDRHKAFLAGLLKDIPLLFGTTKDTPHSFLSGYGLHDLPTRGMSEQEIRLWGKNHQHLSADVAQDCGLPKDIVDALSCHHDFKNLSTHPPLIQSLLLATRWAELLHAPNDSLSALFGFELYLAQRLGLDTTLMDRFRADCAAKFNLLLKQIDIENRPAESRIYELPTAPLRDYYFLVRRVVSCMDSPGPVSWIDVLRFQLRVFWQIDKWTLFISGDASETGEFFRCDGNEYHYIANSGNIAPAMQDKWLQIPIRCQGQSFGVLSLPREQAGGDKAPLHMYLRILGMGLSEYFQQKADRTFAQELAASPFILARIDKHGYIHDASKAFLDTFGLPRVPSGRLASELLHEKLGINIARYTAATAEAKAQGSFISAPEDHFPGTPVFVARCPATFGSEDSYLQLSDVHLTSPLQSLALSHAELLETIFKNIEDNLCLLDPEGRIVWADSELELLVSRFFFSVAQSAGRGDGPWGALLLAKIEEPTKINLLWPDNGSLVPRTAVVSPLGPADSRQYLAVIRKPRSFPAEQIAVPSAISATLRDPLTGLYGYSQFHLLLEHCAEVALKQRSQLGILYFTMNSLRDINKEAGFQKGDFLLRRVAEILTSACRPGQDYPCRYGSDKFAIIVTRAAKVLMDSMAAKIIENMEQHNETLGKTGLGLALVPPGHVARAGLDSARSAAKESVHSGKPYLWGE